MSQPLHEVVSYAAFLTYRAARLRAPVDATAVPPDVDRLILPELRTLVVATPLPPDSRGLPR
jgi:hypothetical protein